MEPDCLICGGSSHRVVFQEFEVNILRCRRCGHVFSSFQVDPHYSGYFGEGAVSGDQFWWNEAHQRMYAEFCERFIVGKSGRLLDVGCGLGFFVKALEPFQDWQTVGCEISAAAVQFARTSLGLNNVMRLDRTGGLDFPPNYFDIVTLWDVLEHLPCPDPLLGNLGSILKEGGLLFLHTPNVQVQLLKARLKKRLKGMQPGVHYLEAKDHVHLYSMRSIRRLLERNGFSRVAFTHLHPIQGVAGGRSRFLTAVKNQWFWCAKAVFDLSFGLVNLDNLFVVAGK